MIPPFKKGRMTKTCFNVLLHRNIDAYLFELEYTEKELRQ
jgi:hypothetical protein